MLLPLLTTFIIQADFCEAPVLLGYTTALIQSSNASLEGGTIVERAFHDLLGGFHKLLAGYRAAHEAWSSGI